jgi:hypothetical protein
MICIVQGLLQQAKDKKRIQEIFGLELKEE